MSDTPPADSRASGHSDEEGPPGRPEGQSVPCRSDQQNVPCHSEEQSGSCHSEEQSVPCHSEERSDEESGHAAPGRGAYADDLYCPDCGYSLRGLTSDRCPECGLRLDFIESAVSLIPWERRREIGRFRAYWRTVLQVMFRAKTFSRAVFQPVSYADAQSFRWTTISHAAVPIMLGPLACHLAGADFLADAADDYGLWFVLLLHACVLLGLVAFTGLPSYFFHPRYLPVDLQDRALALSYYASAPLAWTALGVSLIVTGLALYDVRRTVDLLLVVLGWIFVSVLVGACWGALMSLAGRTLRRTSAVLWMTIGVPVLWIIAGGLILVALPLVALYLAVIIHSLR